MLKPPKLTGGWPICVNRWRMPSASILAAGKGSQRGRRMGIQMLVLSTSCLDLLRPAAHAAAFRQPVPVPPACLAGRLQTQAARLPARQHASLFTRARSPAAAAAPLAGHSRYAPQPMGSRLPVTRPTATSSRAASASSSGSTPGSSSSPSPASCTACTVYQRSKAIHCVSPAVQRPLNPPPTCVLA